MVVFIVLMITGIIIESNRLEVTEKEIIMDTLPDSVSPLKIVHISDLHGKDFKNRLVKVIKNANPDMVVFSGDMIDSHNDEGDVVVAILEALENRYPVYYSYGNHDLYCRLNTPEVFYRYKEKVENAGCILLDDQMSVYTKKDEDIEIYGLSSIPYGKGVHEISLDKSSFNVYYINQKIGKPNGAHVNILIAHDPTWFDLYAQWGADIVLSGHMHGGAIRLPFIGGVFSPNRELFPKYDAGLFEKDKTVMHVSRGVGTSVERIRVFNRPEITIITVRTGDREADKR